MNKSFLYIFCLLFNFVFSEIGAKKIASGFDKPIYICSFPNYDNHHIVLEQKGTIKIIKDNQILRAYFLDIRDRVHRPLFPGDEMGLLGFAFDPDYIENNYIYVHYNDKEDNTIISRFEVIDGIALPDQQTIREHEIVVLRTEFKVALNAYLSGLPDQTRVRSLSELIHFNEQNRLEVMPYFQQEQLLAAEATHGLDDLKYKKALGECQRLSRREGIDKALSDYSCSALVAPTSSTPWAIDLINGDNRLGGSSCLAAVSGYPSVTLPMGYITGLPVGLSFIGKAWHDLFIINLAYAFEQASLVRYPPGGSAQLLQ